MKLFDLLKSLNTGTTVNPDAPQSARQDDRSRLLDELGSLLELLDAPAAAPTANALARDSAAIPDEATPLLNLDAIFEGVAGEAADDVDATPTQSPPESRAAAQQPASHQQLVRSLLDELLPMLEKALGDRLDQLDNDTLEQWTKAASSATPTSTSR
jgi:hypothetical protein